MWSRVVFLNTAQGWASWGQVAVTHLLHNPPPSSPVDTDTVL